MTGACECIVRDIHRFQADKLVLRLRPNTPFHFDAGQYVELELGPCEARYYSIASRPGATDLELHIKDNGNGGLGTYAMTRLQVGDTAVIKGPFGKCVWNDTGHARHVMIAGGIGIIPIKAIVETAIASGYSGQVNLYWGVQQVEDLYLQKSFDDYALAARSFSYSTAVAQPLHDNIWTKELDFRGARIYISGPPAMFEPLVPGLLTRGARAEAIVSDQQDVVDRLVRAHAESL